MEKSKLVKLKEKVSGCKKCELWKSRTNVVFGQGNSYAEILLIGEAPGANEDKQGIPFCGAAGKVLDKLLKSASLTRKDIYIANILKCRPPKNRNPKKEEITSCSEHLDRQIAVINPKVICCLGNFSTKYILKKYGLEKEIRGISKIRGKVFPISTLSGKVKIIPLYHPAVATYNANMLDTLKQDFKKAVTQAKQNQS